MNSSIQPQEDAIKIANKIIPKKYLRIIFPLVLGAFYLIDSGFRYTLLNTLADAYINVGVFVAVTLFLYYAAEKFFGFDITKLKDSPAWQQIGIASVLGALPGCGGAIIVVSQYSAGQMSFAAFVAVLVATMGDAAFLLLAKAPQIGLIVTVTGLIVAIISGLVVNAIHDKDFLRQPVLQKLNNQLAHKNLLPIPKQQSMLWMFLLIAAFPLTLLSAFQISVTDISILDYSINPMLLIGVIAAVLGVLMWSFLPLKYSYQGFVAEDSVAINKEQKRPEKNDPIKEWTKDESSFSHMVLRVIHDTNFIMVWVILAFLLFEMFIYYTGISLEGLFVGANSSLLWLAPLLGVLVGLLPGCGPQIIIASLYLQGIVPISTLLGNAISNDGDALFPALALTPKAAVLATVYSTIPALILAYSVHFFITYI